MQRISRCNDSCPWDLIKTKVWLEFPWDFWSPQKCKSLQPRLLRKCHPYKQGKSSKSTCSIFYLHCHCSSTTCRFQYCQRNLHNPCYSRTNVILTRTQTRVPAWPVYEWLGNFCVWFVTQKWPKVMRGGGQPTPTLPSKQKQLLAFYQYFPNETTFCKGHF